MLLGIISDTHDDLARTGEALRILQNQRADALIHCGDLASDEIVFLCSQLPFYFVFGNHDADFVPQLLAASEQSGATCLEWGGSIELSGKRIAVAHGHMTMDIRPLIAGSPDYLLTGHTHEPLTSWQGSTHRICPGALYRANPPTFAILNLETDEVEFIPLA